MHKTIKSILLIPFLIINITYANEPINTDSHLMSVEQQKIKPIVLAEQKVESLEIHNNILYLSSGRLGVDIIDVKNMNQPFRIGHIDLPGRALKSKRYDNLLLVAQNDIKRGDKKGWLSIIDIANPAQPKLLSSLKYGGRVYDFLVEDGKLIIDESNRINKKSTFHIVDIRNPKKPKEIVSTLLKTDVQSIALIHNWLWAPSARGCGVYGYNLNNLKKLKYTNYFSIENKRIYQIQKDKNIIAVHVGSCKPVIAFFADGNHLEKGLASSIIKEEEMHDNNTFLLKENKLFVAEGKNGVNIYDLTDLSKPVFIQNIKFSGRYIKNFAISDDRIYGVDTKGGIYIRELLYLSQEQFVTLLYNAIEENDAHKVNELLDQGIPIEFQGYGRNSPIESAARSGKNKALKALLDRGANPNFNHGQAIILAALSKKDETLRLLYQYGGDIKLKDKNDECTPLHYIAQEGKVETAKFLISKGADINAMCRGRETPMTWATFGKNQPMIDFLNSLQK